MTTPTSWEETEMAKEIHRMLCEDYGQTVADLMLRHRDAYDENRAAQLEPQIQAAEDLALQKACLDVACGRPAKDIN